MVRREKTEAEKRAELLAAWSDAQLIDLKPTTRFLCKVNTPNGELQGIVESRGNDITLRVPTDVRNTGRVERMVAKKNGSPGVVNWGNFGVTAGKYGDKDLTVDLATVAGGPGYVDSEIIMRMYGDKSNFRSVSEFGDLVDQCVRFTETAPVIAGCNIKILPVPVSSSLEEI